jgi:hypothetical protein
MGNYKACPDMMRPRTLTDLLERKVKIKMGVKINKQKEK